jgi:probable F420-dependent oxidoreductase
MKFWQSIAWAEAEQLIEIAKFAEAVGFHGVVNAEHIFLTKATKSRYPYTEDGKMNHDLDYAYPDVWSSFGAMAAVTSRLHFTSSVYLLPLRSPLEVAKAAGTLALISNNRVTIGFGVGWLKEEFDAMGVDFHTRGRRTDEMIEVMRKLWSGGSVSHQGRFFNFTDIQMAPVPTKPVPIYCGGKSPAALHRAATLCDGYIGPGHAAEEVPSLLAELKRLRREAGRDHLPFETIIPIQPMVPPPDVGTFKRLEELGMTATFNAPFDAGGIDRGRTTAVLGRTSTIDEKKRVMERYARDVIHNMSGAGS